MNKLVAYVNTASRNTRRECAAGNPVRKNDNNWRVDNIDNYVNFDAEWNLKIKKQWMQPTSD
jgi:hypothetical protein